jgi:hypothetical protein
MTVARKRTKVFISFDEGSATKLHEAIAMPVYGSSASGRIVGFILEPTKEEQSQHRGIGVFDVNSHKHIKEFEDALWNGSCTSQSTAFGQTLKDGFGAIHQIINIV